MTLKTKQILAATFGAALTVLVHEYAPQYQAEAGALWGVLIGWLHLEKPKDPSGSKADQ